MSYSETLSKANVKSPSYLEENSISHFSSVSSRSSNPCLNLYGLPVAINSCSISFHRGQPKKLSSNKQILLREGSKNSDSGLCLNTWSYFWLTQNLHFLKQPRVKKPMPACYIACHYNSDNSAVNPVIRIYNKCHNKHNSTYYDCTT